MNEDILMVLVKSLTDEIGKRIDKCEKDCRDALDQLQDLRSRIDVADGEHLREKLDGLLQELQELKIASVVEDVKHNHQLAEILRRLNFNEEAKLVEQGKPIINISTNNMVSDNQKNQVGDDNRQDNE